MRIKLLDARLRWFPTPVQPPQSGSEKEARPRLRAEYRFGNERQGKLGVAAGWVGLTTAAGAYIGHQRGLDDVVTVEHVPYQETVRVAVGSHVQQGCHQYHYGYDAMKGEFGYHYGYDASCRQTVTDYETRYTGRTLFKEESTTAPDSPTRHCRARC